MPDLESCYREYAASPRLRKWVACFWYQTIPAGDRQVHRVLPDGCIDILFELDGALAGTGYVVGMMNRALVVERPGGMRVFGVRLRPGAAAAFFRVPLFHFTDTSVDLTCLWSGSTPLSDRVCAAISMEQRAAILEQELISRLTLRLTADADISRRDTSALDVILRHPSASIERMCRDLSISRQGLAKAFRNSVGLSPKALARIVRMQCALRQMEACATDTIEWCDLAQLSGYCDQSHLIRDFRELTGLSPQALLEERRVPVSISPIQ